jgi:hypothetical protein
MKSRQLSEEMCSDVFTSSGAANNWRKIIIKKEQDKHDVCCWLHLVENVVVPLVLVALAHDPGLRSIKWTVIRRWPPKKCNNTPFPANR